MKPALNVVSAIIENENGEILVAQRPPGKLLAGMWEFPGGKIENGESPEAALHRELREELELDVRVDRAMGAFPYTYDWGSIVLHVFVVRALNTPMPTPDVQVFRWQRGDRIEKNELAPADIEPLVQYLAQQTGPQLK